MLRPKEGYCPPLPVRKVKLLFDQVYHHLPKKGKVPGLWFDLDGYIHGTATSFEEMMEKVRAHSEIKHEFQQLTLAGETKVGVASYRLTVNCGVNGFSVEPRSVDAKWASTVRASLESYRLARVAEQRRIPIIAQTISMTVAATFVAEYILNGLKVNDWLPTPSASAGCLAFLLMFVLARRTPKGGITLHERPARSVGELIPWLTFIASVARLLESVWPLLRQGLQG